MYYIYYPQVDMAPDSVTVAVIGQVVKIKRVVANTEFVEIQTPDGQLNLGIVCDDSLCDIPVGTKFNRQTGLPLTVQMS